MPHSDIWSRFTGRALACYTPYADRVARLRSEFARVGLSDVREFWQIPNPYDKLLMDAIPNKRGLSGVPGHFSCSINHYRIAKTYLTLGVSDVLIMEDDIVFLKDTDLLRRVVTSLPADADVALFEWRTARNRAGQNAESLSRGADDELWHRADDMQLVGCGMYYLSQKGLEWYVSKMEAATHGDVFRTSDGWFRRGAYGAGIVPYCARIRAAVQDSDARCNSRHSPTFVAQEYANAGSPDFSLYNMRIDASVPTTPCPYVPSRAVDVLNRFVFERGYSTVLVAGADGYDTFSQVVAPVRRYISPGAVGPGVITKPVVQFLREDRSLRGRADVIFLDGTHQHQRLADEIDSALGYVAAGGVVAVHDCLPRNLEEGNSVRGGAREWTGDCWKAVAAAFSRSKFACYSVDVDHGCGIIDTAVPSVGDAVPVSADSLGWDDYVSRCDTLLHVVPPELVRTLACRQRGDLNA